MILSGLPLASTRAVWGSGKSNRACSGATMQAAGDPEVVPCASDVATAPGACALAGNETDNPTAATAPKIAARRKNIWPGMYMLESLL